MRAAIKNSPIYLCAAIKKTAPSTIQIRRDQNHYSNLTSKIMKMCKQILKKKHSRTSPEIQFKELNEKPRNT